MELFFFVFKIRHSDVFILQMILSFIVFLHKVR